MAARSVKITQDPKTIERIRSTVETGLLIKRLTDHVKGETNLAPTQVTAALGLLKKTLADLAVVQHTGADDGPIKIQVGWESE